MLSRYAVSELLFASTAHYTFERCETSMPISVQGLVRKLSLLEQTKIIDKD